MNEFDTAITAAINALAGHSAAGDFLMIWTSAIGIHLLVLSVAAQWWRRAERPRIRHVLVAAGLSFALGIAINLLILAFLDRVRPYDAGVTTLIAARSNDFSFPSDHTTAAFAIAFAFLLNGLRRSGLAYLAAAILMGLSRIYVGSHYAGDVAGGTLTALLAALLVRQAYRRDSRLDRFITGIL
ncbi:phosphatase PAP2 family protein [Oceanibacterium hippocampi]|uniref:Undecaprenyl-diphosphatase BcrC n=1 Tax=Oceanibacterium hippocampi TaxID=745714 RepID=A0A1Y5SN50_9PROT|nr:phosphatase PAP2 family protein [Oceanibacterium hippocampi]SLN41459.1 Undecaprenyl-diphosphatase BcrC [Oceanibacterium hippocampi]